MAATSATMVQPRPPRAAAAPPAPPPVYYDYEEPIRRPLWPWLLALGFVILAGVGGYLLYHQISNKIGSNSGVAVDNYQGLTQQQAVQKVHAAGLGTVLKHQDSAQAEFGLVVGQDPSPGTRVDKKSNVTLLIGSGPPKHAVPNLVGKSETDAIGALADLRLKWKTLQVPSSQPAGTVLAQDPQPGVKVVEGTVVHFNVSKGPQPVAVPNVVGMTADSASSTLQAQGFAVKTVQVESNQPGGVVVTQDPSANTSAAKGSTVTISVSKGPKTTALPDVTSQDVTSAGATLHSAGFNVHVVHQPTSDPTLDGIVLSQDPGGGTQAKPGTVVTLTVGQLVAQTDTTGTTPTTP
jgi:serine/threonine-protein kinase